MSEQVLEVTVDGTVATVTFKRPEAFNALDQQLANALRNACRSVADNDGVRVVILTGAGKAFMAGGDLKMMREAPVLAVNSLIPPVHEAVRLLAEMPKPVIAAVHGAVAGAGFSLALAADFVVAADTTRFSFAYSDIGASCDGGISWNLPRLVGTRKALEIAMLGEPFDAKQALELSLVNEVVDAGALQEAARALADRLAERSPYALGKLKNLMRSSFDHDLASQLDREQSAFTDCAARPDFVGAIDRFFSKRLKK